MTSAAGQTAEVVVSQTKGAWRRCSLTRLPMVIAMNPSGQFNEVIGTIRATIAELFGEEKAGQVRIQYGGSVKPENISEFMNQPEIDGALVGGASLAADDFINIVQYK